MSVSLNLVSYTPADPNDPNNATNVQNLSDIGTVQQSVLDGNTLTITTDKGKFVFDAVGLDAPGNVSDQDLSDAAKNVGNLTSDKDIMADIYNIMALFQQTDNSERNSAVQARAADRELQAEKIDEEVAKLKEAAGIAMAMGIAAGVVQIAGGALQMKFASNLNIGQAWSSFGGGGSGILNAVGQGVSGDINADAKKDEADATRADSRAQEMTDFINSLRDLIRDVQDKLEAIQQSQNDTMKQILA